MPVILNPGSEELRSWLDPSRHDWSRDLQALLKPFKGDLEVYPVSKDVGKVGNNSPSFLIPLDSKDNKANIANFFAKASKQSAQQAKEDGQSETKKQLLMSTGDQLQHETSNNKADLASPRLKRNADSADEDEPDSKKMASGRTRPRDGRTSASRNEVRSPSKSRPAGTQKITKFFRNNT